MLGIILIQSIFSGLPQKEEKFYFDRNKIFQNPNAAFLEIIILIYAAIVFIGLLNLIKFLANNFGKKILPPAAKLAQTTLAITEEQASKLLFRVIFSIFIIYLVPGILLILRWRGDFKSLSLTLNLIVEISIVLLILKNMPAKSLGFNLKRGYFSSTLKAYITILPLISGLLFLNYLILEKIGIEFSLNPVIELFLSLKNNFLFSLLILQIVLFAPCAEELFFRGFLYNLTRRQYGFTASALITSSIFSLLHRSPQLIIPLFMLSITLCYIYEKTKNIAVPILFHFIHNGLSAALLLAIKSLN
jgi:membrane protease YdiL (CAAX protease family)